MSLVFLLRVIKILTYFSAYNYVQLYCPPTSSYRLVGGFSHHCHLNARPIAHQRVHIDSLVGFLTVATSTPIAHQRVDMDSLVGFPTVATSTPNRPPMSPDQLVGGFSHRCHLNGRHIAHQRVQIDSLVDFFSLPSTTPACSTTNESIGTRWLLVSPSSHLGTGLSHHQRVPLGSLVGFHHHSTSALSAHQSHHQQVRKDSLVGFCFIPPRRLPVPPPMSPYGLVGGFSHPTTTTAYKQRFTHLPPRCRPVQPPTSPYGLVGVFSLLPPRCPPALPLSKRQGGWRRRERAQTMPDESLGLQVSHISPFFFFYYTN